MMPLGLTTIIGLIIPLLAIGSPAHDTYYLLNTGSINVERIDVTGFPTVNLFLGVTDDTGADVSGLTTANFTIQEDTVEIEDFTLSSNMIGLQTALVGDFDVQPSSFLVVDRFRNVLLDLLASPTLDRTNRSDWITINLTTEDPNHRIVPWTNDYNLASNSLYVYDVKSLQKSSRFPLFESVFEILRDLEKGKPGVPVGLRQMLVVVSDGTRDLSEFELQQLTGKAQALGVPIHVANLGAKASAPNVRRMALLTDGLFLEDEGATGTLLAYCNRILGRRTEYKISYRSKASDGGTHVLKTSYRPDGEATSSSTEVPFQAPVQPTVQPPDNASKLSSPTLLFAAIGAAALTLLALSYVLSRPPRRERVAEAIRGRVVRDVTEVFTVSKRARLSQSEARAVLKVISGGNSEGKLLPITKEITRIGRDPSLADVIFADPSVSRLHARIVEEEPNIYRIFDEGSANGTYVNDQLVAIMHGQQLHNSDEIDFGTVRLHFALAHPPASSSQLETSPLLPSEPEAQLADHDSTQPFNDGG